MSQGAPPANFLMRWWRKKHEKLLHIALILRCGQPLEPEDVKLLREGLLEWRDEVPLPSVELSVYACARQDARDLGHALGVVAVSLALLQKKAAADYQREVDRRSGATLLIDHEALRAADLSATHTPDNCHTLCVAAPYHWDLCAAGSAVERLFDFLCEQLKDVSRLYKIDRHAKSSATEQPFKDQVTLALDACCRAPWSLREHGPCGDGWRQAGAWTIQDQIDALRRLAQAIGYALPT
jgi:hypothetical protein